MQAACGIDQQDVGRAGLCRCRSVEQRGEMDAAAKLMSTVDSTLDTLINHTGLG